MGINESSDIISHPGVVEKVDNETIYVRIMNLSACSACHVKAACSMAEMQEKIIEIRRNFKDNYKTGEQVNVVLEKSLGKKAVVLAYLLPLLILVISLIILTSFSVNEGIAALVSISLMGPYYLVLYLMRNRLKKTFDFKIA
jgi:sigma-E factor negative regulatory protein RseC